MGNHRGQYEMRLPQKLWRISHLLRQPTKPAFLINALILMAVMRDFKVVAIRAPHFAQTGRSMRDSTKQENYQSNYENEAATISRLSTGYSTAHNYYHNAASHGVADEISTYGGTAGNTLGFTSLQQHRNAPNVGFIPTTMTAAGQHFVVAAHGVGAQQAGTNAATSPQIDGVRAMERYRAPAVKIDYEINAANYDIASGTSNGINADEQSTGVIETNDAYNIAKMPHITRLQQQQRQQQKYHHQQQHQLAFADGSMPGEQNDSAEMVAFKNYEQPSATTLAYIETKHQQPNTNEQYLRNLEMLQYANYEQKPRVSAVTYNQEVFVKGGKHNQPYSFISYEQPAHPNVFRINHHTQEHQRYQQNQQQHRQQHPIHDAKGQRDNVYNDDSLKSQSQHHYTHAHMAHTPHSRSLDLHNGHHTINTLQSSLPPIEHTLHHTPASSAAIAGVPLSKHVEVVKHVPIQHYNREHIPYNHSVPIEIPTPVITTVTKPMPINIPISQTVAVPQLKVVRIPIDKVNPMPVERAVPFIVEKRVPYQVEKQIAKPVYYPYPIRVPVVTTIVHKLPRHNHHENGHHHHHHFRPRLLYTQVFKKTSPFG